MKMVERQKFIYLTESWVSSTDGKICGGDKMKMQGFTIIGADGTYSAQGMGLL